MFFSLKQQENIFLFVVRCGKKTESVTDPQKKKKEP